jgi:hypothetical protein
MSLLLLLVFSKNAFSSSLHKEIIFININIKINYSLNLMGMKMDVACAQDSVSFN